MRCHRIGQEHPIDVFRFTMNGFAHVDDNSEPEDEQSWNTFTLDEYSREKQMMKRKSPEKCCRTRSEKKSKKYTNFSLFKIIDVFDIIVFL